MSNQIAKMFSQQFGTKVTLKSQQTGSMRSKQGLGYGKKKQRVSKARKKKNKATR